MESVLLETFQQSQKSVQRHNQLVGKLKKAHVGCKDYKHFNEEFFKCLQHALVEFKREPAVERVLDFAVQFSISTATESGDKNIFSFLMESLLALHSSRDKGVRMRAVEMVRKLLDKMEDDAEIDVNLCDRLIDIMLIRLNDKIPAVRCQAVLALARLQDPGDTECPVQGAFQKLAMLDSSPDVRKTVLSHIFVRADTIDILIGRTRDVKDNVRRTAFAVLAERVSIRSLTIAQRRELLKQGLADRIETVKQACVLQLLPAWMKQCDGNFVQYLKRLDVESGDEWVEKSVVELLKTKSPAELIDGFLTQPDCRELVENIRSPKADSTTSGLDPDVSFYWRCLCQHLRGLGSSAEEYLDQILPEGASLCPFLMRCICDADTSKVDNDDTATRVFVLQQLFKTAPLLDFADEVGRRRLRDLVCKLLPMDNVPDVLVPMLAACLRAVESSHDARMDILLEIISDIHMPMTEQTMDADQLQSTLANMSLSVEHVPLEALLKCLSVLQELLLDVTRPSLSPSLRALTDSLVLPCIQTPDPVIREAAVKCLGLCCLLSLDFARQHMLLFLQALEVDVEEVQKVALQVVFDLLHTYGLNSFEIKSAKDSTSTEHDENGEEKAEVQPEEAKSNVATGILSVVSRYLDSQVEELCHTAMLGFAKLILAGRLVSSKVLLRLFLLWFNPACDDDLFLRQTLAAFFPVFASNSRFNQEQLGSILLPALTTVWQAPDSSPLALINVNDLTQFLIEFTDHRHLRGKHAADADMQERTVHEDIAVKVANKLLTDEEDIDERSLCRVLSLLYLLPTSPVAEELQALDNQLLEAVSDKMALRYLAKFRSNISGSGKTARRPAPGKTPSSRMRPAATRRTTVTRTATKSARKSQAVILESDEDDDGDLNEETIGNSPVEARPRLARGCKSKAKQVEKRLFDSSSDEANDDEEDCSD
ncbi:condensin complex subunit 3-like [Sycon ciliatum]|uniref:condensin complex subunit 3-like n=1 Tax=Sycon ciliatum TaxID=27933 RepID=UPI0031F66E7A